MLAVPNFSEGRDRSTIAAVSAAFARGAAVVDRHTDAIHNRTVLTLSGPVESIAAALASGARACLAWIDVERHQGAHPFIGSLDVCPVVYLDRDERVAAREQALAVAEAIAELGVPVFLYGELASDSARRERAFFRQGGVAELRRRMEAGELRSDLGPAEPHPRAGATLVTARPPLVAFNVELDTSDVEIARAVAASLRESGDGLAGVRAIGIDLDGRAQVSTNIHDPITVPIRTVVERVRELAAAHDARPIAGEVVGLVPEASIRGLPEEVPLIGFVPDRHVIERRLGLDARPG